MNSILSIIFSFFLLFSFSQENNSAPEKYLIGISFSPYGFGIKGNSGAESSIYACRVFQENKIKLETGIGFSNFNHLKIEEKYYLIDNYGYTEFSVGNYPKEATHFTTKTYTNTNYIYIPVKMNYTLYEKKMFKFVTFLGANTCFNLNSNSKKTTYKDEIFTSTTNEKTTFKNTPFFFSVLTGIGIEYKFYKNYNLILQPLLRMDLKLDYFGYAMNIGLRRSF